MQFELARDEWKAAENDLDQLTEPAEQMLAMLGQVKAHESRLIEIAVSTAGHGLNGQDVFWDQRLDQLRLALEGVVDLQAPRSVSLTPLLGESPPLVRSRDGGWIHRQHARSVADDDQQPERQEPRR